MRILGVDAALSSTGIALLSTKNREVLHLGKIVTSVTAYTPYESHRLLHIQKEMDALIQIYKPGVLVIENQHVAINKKTAMLLSRVRGVIQLVAAIHDVPCYTLEPTQVKRVVTGTGNAGKELVQQSIVALYQDQAEVKKDLSTIIISGKHKTDDIADALAIAHTYSIDPTIAVRV